MGTRQDDLAAALRRLHRAAGEPSTHEIGKAIGYSHTTVANALRGRRRPTWRVLKAVVTYLEGDLETFRAHWIAVRDLEEPLEDSKLQLNPAGNEQTALGAPPSLEPAEQPVRRLRGPATTTVDYPTADPVPRESAHKEGDVVGLSLDEATRRIRGSRSHAKEILMFLHRPLQIVLGTFNHGGHRTVALPDLRAARVVAEVVPDDVQVEGPVDGRGLDEGARKNNLLLVGSPKRNPVTAEVLSHEATRALLSCEFFAAYGQESELELRVDGEVYGEAALEQESAKLDEHNPADFALLAKIPNPFNPDATVLIVAGRHALGTQGAAEFVAARPEWETGRFEHEVGGGYFAVVIHVEAEGAEDKLVLTEVRAVERSLIKIDASREYTPARDRVISWLDSSDVPISGTDVISFAASNLEEPHLRVMCVDRLCENLDVATAHEINQLVDLASSLMGSRSAALGQAGVKLTGQLIRKGLAPIALLAIGARSKSWEIKSAAVAVTRNLDDPGVLDVYEGIGADLSYWRPVQTITEQILGLRTRLTPEDRDRAASILGRLLANPEQSDGQRARLRDALTTLASDSEKN
jgi:transcriptional regulator with XRE-family HTH domain